MYERKLAYVALNLISRQLDLIAKKLNSVSVHKSVKCTYMALNSISKKVHRMHVGNSAKSSRES